MSLDRQLQTNNRTFVGRYWTEHSVLRRYLPSDADLSILSFGCSTGEELASLAALFPGARLFGCDIDWHNLAAARALIGRAATVFESRDDEIVRHGPFDVIVCNSVLMSHTTIVGGMARGIDRSLWIDVLGKLDGVLKPGGILQIINSNIPFRFHPVASRYEPLRSPLILGPGFVDQFDLEGRHLCTGVAGAGWSALPNRHLGEEGWRELRPTDFHDVHFWKRSGLEKPRSVEDEMIPNLSHCGALATGTMSFRPEPMADPRPSTHVEIDLAWTASGVDTIRLRRTARRIWFDGSVAFTSDTTVDMTASPATAFIEAALGRRSSRLAVDASLSPLAVRARLLVLHRLSVVGRSGPSVGLWPLPALAGVLPLCPREPRFAQSFGPNRTRGGRNLDMVSVCRPPPARTAQAGLARLDADGSSDAMTGVVQVVAPSVSVVVLARNRERELRVVLDQTRQMQYAGPIEVIVVDNGSTDGTRAMLAGRADVRAILRQDNEGVSAWNHGFQAATGDWLLVLDDDCYLEPDGLTRAIDAAIAEDADLVSFLVRDPSRPGFVFNRLYNTGLLSFWGCAVLMKRDVISTVGGFDPRILVWAHELEFMLRFFDKGLRHLYLPSVTALHMSSPGYSDFKFITNHRHLGYIVGARLGGLNAFRALVALLVPAADGFGRRPFAPLYRNLAVAAIEGFRLGRRHHQPVRDDVARAYTRHFPEFSMQLRVRPAARLARPDYRRYFPALMEQSSLQFATAEL